LPKSWIAAKGMVKLLYPFFYHIDPSIVGRQEGSFGKALEANTQKYIQKKIGKNCWEGG